MHVKCTCVPDGARKSTVFHTSVLFARSLWLPGEISHVNVWPYRSSAIRFPSSEKITCRCFTSCSDVRWIVEPRVRVGLPRFRRVQQLRDHVVAGGGDIPALP